MSFDDDVRDVTDEPTARVPPELDATAHVARAVKHCRHYRLLTARAAEPGVWAHALQELAAAYGALERAIATATAGSRLTDRGER
jgi:hypothetical protein